MHKLGRNAVSSDESDSDQGSSTVNANGYRVISPTWRSPPLTTFLRSLDQITLDHARPIIGERKRRGQPPRLRKVPKPERFNDAVPAPAGLPRNCYDDKWYESLPDWARKQLAARDEEYDFPTVP
jgi:hypothetical protein